MPARVIALILLAIAAGSVLVELQSAGGVFSYFARFATRRRYIHQPVPLLIRISMATPAFLLLAGNWLHRPTFKHRARLLLVWLPIVLVTSGFLGQRWRSVTVLVALLAITHLGHRRLSWPVIGVLLASLLAGFVAVNLYRNVVGSSRQVRSIAGTDDAICGSSAQITMVAARRSITASRRRAAASSASAANATAAAPTATTTATTGA